MQEDISSSLQVHLQPNFSNGYACITRIYLFPAPIDPYIREARLAFLTQIIPISTMGVIVGLLMSLAFAVSTLAQMPPMPMPMQPPMPMPMQPPPPPYNMYGPINPYSGGSSGGMMYPPPPPQQMVPPPPGPSPLSCSNFSILFNSTNVTHDGSGRYALSCLWSTLTLDDTTTLPNILWFWTKRRSFHIISWVRIVSIHFLWFLSYLLDG
ncbi:hypothetical protein TNCT_691401 [Trichonephila clavata]|uniref:Uncharacterized protein n=1 Tax=Trichonephila clavata TaxID=2740835 RepID=A0A8X6LXY9_TRICU|nr:hypothetical protein TNCT_691401 [Trichonephila clavata]